MTSENRSKTTEEPVNLDQVMGSLKKLDARNKRMMLWMYIIYIVLAVIYTGLLILNPDSELTVSNRIQGVMYVLIFGMAALYFRRHFKKNKAVDYSAPVLEMLNAARNRHKLWTPETIKFLVALVGLTDIVITWAILDDKFMHGHSMIIRVLVVQAGYFVLMGSSFLVGYASWRKKSWPLVRNLTRIIEELEREET